VEVFAVEWLNLLFRWAHLIVAIGWIGTSFYFMALDYSLNKQERTHPGVMGTAWQVHGGGFYRVEKYTVAPPALPEVLHWFKWEAYLTWVTGFGLLAVQYYYHAHTFLIDPAVLPLARWEAIAISVVSLAAGWFAYDAMCRSRIGDNAVTLGIWVFTLIMAASVFFGQVFSGRGAFIHIGTFLGTIMAVNVFGVIIPNQKKMIAQMIAGQEPDARYGLIGKQRSTHNNYLTLPVLLMMISHWYPFITGHPHPWLIVALVVLCGGLIRHLLNRVDAGDDWNKYGWTVPGAAVALMVAIYVTTPRPHSSTADNKPVNDSQVLAIAQQHCVTCHARAPSHPQFREPPKNVSLETIADMRRFAHQIHMQTVQNHIMPPGNPTGMTPAERNMLGFWVNGHK
jgi:uncharacterized membrane protein